MPRLLLLLLLSGLSFPQNASHPHSAVSPAAAISPDDGKVTGNLYESSYFGFRVSFPKGWSAHGPQTSKRVMELGKSSLTDKKVVSNASAEEAQKRTFNLLTVFERPLGTPGAKPNRALMVIAEDVSSSPGIKTGADYLLNAQALLQKAGWQPVGLTKLRIGGADFARLIMKNPDNSFESMSATIRKGYALAFVAIADSQERLADATQAEATFNLQPKPIKQAAAHPASKQTK
jgi:hypothetical protein